MPKAALEYFFDGESDNRLYLRATSIRNCLENIVDTIFIHILNDEQRKDWENKNLFNRLNSLSEFFPDERSEKIHSIRKIGNKGAHHRGHKELTEEDLDLSLKDLSQICEWTITAYFVKNGFTEHPWIPTVFSTLPPIYRIRILEEVLASESKKFEHIEAGFLLLIDKLAMAYLKNRERVKSIQFVEGMYEKRYVNNLFKEQMLDKLESLWKEIDNLPISTNLEETRRNLDKILPAVRKEDESLFVTLFIAITSQNS